MGHDDLILCNLEIDQVLGEVNSRGDMGHQLNPKKESACFVSDYVIFDLHRTVMKPL